MKTPVKLAIALAGASALAGCTAGYPSTEERVENVERTMRNEKLEGERLESRDSRFSKETGVPVTPPPGK